MTAGPYDDRAGTMAGVPTYLSYDKSELAYREVGAGLPVLVIPGGPWVDDPAAFVAAVRAAVLA